LSGRARDTEHLYSPGPLPIWRRYFVKADLVANYRGGHKLIYYRLDYFNCKGMENSDGQMGRSGERNGFHEL
jgi:hypothetical protein